MNLQVSLGGRGILLRSPMLLFNLDSYTTDLILYRLEAALWIPHLGFGFGTELVLKINYNNFFFVTTTQLYIHLISYEAIQIMFLVRFYYFLIIFLSCFSHPNITKSTRVDRSQLSNVKLTMNRSRTKQKWYEMY